MALPRRQRPETGWPCCQRVSDRGDIALQTHHMPQGGEEVKKAIAVIVIIVLHLVAACAPAAPTPTASPTASPTPSPGAGPDKQKGSGGGEKNEG